MKKRFISMAMALLFIASLPVSAFAEEYDISVGDITVEAKDDGQYVTQANNTETGNSYKQSSETVITGTSQTNTVTIKAAEGQTANVTFENLNIDVSNTGTAMTYDAATNSYSYTEGKGAVVVTGEGDTVIDINGANTLNSGVASAGLQKDSTGELIITDSNGDGASLAATGGQYSAGIGGGAGKDGNNITIESGNVTGNGDEYAAGIGGGYCGGADNIEINGGTVNGNGGFGAAGIGSGMFGDVKTITINGGTVNAKGGDTGAGIGSGRYGDAAGIIINGGKITATGGSDGSGIGGGMEGSVEDISINDAEVNATSGYGAAGIGGGTFGKLTGNVVISGDAKVTSTASDKSGYKGAAIGSGAYKDADGNNVDGEEVTPDTSKLSENGFVALTVNGIKRIVTAAKAAVQTVTQTVKLYRVVDKDGKDISYTAEVKDGVLTVKVDADYAALTGTLAGMSALKAQGVESISFVTNGATSSFAVADLLAKGNVSDSYKLTHDGATVTFTLGTTDISAILK